jgi:hypothetical protein
MNSPSAATTSCRLDLNQLQVGPTDVLSGEVAEELHDGVDHGQLSDI